MSDSSSKNGDDGAREDDVKGPHFSARGATGRDERRMCIVGYTGARQNAHLL